MAYSPNTVERLTSLEVNERHQDSKLAQHDALIVELDTKLDKLLKEISGIKSALLLMAAAIGANVPALQPIFSFLGKLF